MLKRILRNMLGITIFILVGALVLSYCQGARNWADRHMTNGPRHTLRPE